VHVIVLLESKLVENASKNGKFTLEEKAYNSTASYYDCWMHQKKKLIYFLSDFINSASKLM
jgi:hypothetical protein